MTLICNKLQFFFSLCRLMKGKQTQAQICCHPLALPLFISYSLPANNKPNTSQKLKPQGNREMGTTQNPPPSHTLPLQTENSVFS